jgi:hypothetical protein
MSFGVAFAFPAYDNSLGGGANPFTQAGPTLDLIFTGVPTVDSTFEGQSLDVNFLTQQYQLPAQYAVWDSAVGALAAKTFSQIITFTRASTATYFDSTGTLQTAAVDAPRFDYNPTTLAAQGFLVEEARTNSIRNSTGVGVVAGSPGTMPTNWSGSTGTTNGVTRTVVGTGTENGISYVDVTYAGTAIANGSISISEELTTQTVATAGQIWTITNFLKLVAGSFANTASRNFFLNSYTAVGAFVSSAISTSNNFPAAGPTTAALNTQRYFFTGTLSGATTARVGTGLFFSFNAGAVINFTLRIGLPQLELGAFATSAIPTSTVEVIRAADVATINTLTPWYNATEGSLYAMAIPQASNASGYALVEVSTDISNRIGLFKLITTGNASLAVLAGGVTQASTNSGAWSTIGKLVGAYKTDNFASSLNGSSVSTDIVGSIPTVTTMTIGRRTDGANVLNGYLQRITYYPRRLTDAELQAITV